MAVQRHGLPALVVAAALFGLPAQAHPWDGGGGAALRGTVVLTDGSVRLSDLFAGIDHDRTIGPAPEPGGRVVVEAAQLLAIARQFNVDWHPGGTGDRSVLERPGSPFPRADAMVALRTALLVAGIPDDCEIEVPVYVPPVVSVDGSAVAEVGQLEYDPVSGRFTALLSVVAAGMSPAHVRLAGRVQTMVELPVASRRLLPGDVLAANDMRTTRLPTRLIHTDAVQLPGQAIGMVLRHPLAAGALLPLNELSHPMLVHKNASVTMQLDAPGLSVSAQGVAGEDGALGDRVRVMNPVSRAVMSAEVTGQGRVRLTAGQPAVLPPGRQIPVGAGGAQWALR